MGAENEWIITKMSTTEAGGKGYLQASIVRVPGDNELGSTLVAFLRDANGYWIYRSISNDDGNTWTDPAPTALPNPDQMSQAIYLHSGLLMLIYNPSQSMATEPSAGDRYSNCHHLAVGLSKDYGLTWQSSRMLEYAYDGMFNYPVALQDPGCDNIYLTYSVQTNEQKGCAMLEGCTAAAQNTMAYIKFTIITEQWVLNDFDFNYDMSDDCVWSLSPAMGHSKAFQTTVMASDTATSDDVSTIIILSSVLGVLIIGNLIWGYFLCIKRKSLQYQDLDSPDNSVAQEYETTK